MKIFIKQCPIFLILVILSVLLTACSAQKDNKSQPSIYSLPRHLYNSSSDCIAYTNNQYLYNYKTRKAMGIFNYDKNIFIDTRGHYLGEITQENLLLRNTLSPYITISLGTQATIPTAPTPPTPPTRATVPTLPSNWQDIFISNTNKSNLTSTQTKGPKVNGSANYHVGKNLKIIAKCSEIFYFYDKHLANQLV